MSDLSELHQQLAKLRTLRASGLAGIKTGEREVQYKSDAQISEAIADLEQRIAAHLGQGLRMVRFVSSKGL